MTSVDQGSWFFFLSVQLKADLVIPWLFSMDREILAWLLL